MKKILFLFLIGLVGSSVIAQSCSKFYPFTEGTTAQITNYNGKDKITSVTEYTVTNLRTESGKEIATLESKVNDKNGKEIVTTQFEYTCADGTISIDFQSLMNNQAFEQFKDFESEVSGTNLDLPNSLNVGQSLPDASIDIKISMSGINMDMKTMITDRKVVGNESVSTPAGTFDCWVITYTIDLNMSMGMSQTSTAKQWIAEGVGMVKQEDYNKKGKATSSSLLTGFKK